MITRSKKLRSDNDTITLSSFTKKTRRTRKTTPEPEVSFIGEKRKSDDTPSSIYSDDEDLTLYNGPDKHILISLLKNQNDTLINDLSREVPKTDDPYYDYRRREYKKIIEHFSDMISSYSNIDDDDLIEKFKKCFNNNDSNEIKNTIHINQTKKLLLNTNTPPLGYGTWGSVLLLQGYDNDELKYSIACKLMYHYKFNINEILYFILLKNEFLQRNIPHFPLMITYFYCNTDSVLTKLPYISEENLPYFILLTELGDGTLKDKIINNNISYHNYETIIYNSFAQLIMAYCFFNKLGHLHKDSNNPANFLFKNIIVDDDKNYFKYNVKINNKTSCVYIQNIGFLWLLNDFGISLPTANKNNNFTLDDIKNLFDGVSFWLNMKYGGHPKTMIINNFIISIKDLCDKSKNDLATFMKLLLADYNINKNLYKIDNISQEQVINNQGYNLDFDLDERVNLPLMGYIDYKSAF